MPFLSTLGTMGSHLSGQSWVTFTGNAASAAHEIQCGSLVLTRHVNRESAVFKTLNTESLKLDRWYHSLFLFLAKQPYVIALFKNFIYLAKKWWHCILWHIACIFSQQYNGLQTYHVKCFFIPACTAVVGLFWSKLFSPSSFAHISLQCGKLCHFFQLPKAGGQVDKLAKKIYFSSL